MASRQDAELPLLIMDAGRLLRQRLQRSGCPACPSILHLGIVKFVAEKGSVSMKEIANFLGITPPSATSAVSRLVRSGHLVRVGGTADKRMVLIALGPAAKRGLSSARSAIIGHLRAALSRLTAREKEELTAILKKILADHL